MWKSRKTYGLVAVEDNEKATLRCSIRGSISCLLCYVECGCGRNTPV